MNLLPSWPVGVLLDYWPSSLPLFINYTPNPHNHPTTIVNRWHNRTFIPPQSQTAGTPNPHCCVAGMRLT